jgi:hypothetical protein
MSASFHWEPAEDEDTRLCTIEYEDDKTPIKQALQGKKVTMGTTCPSDRMRRLWVCQGDKLKRFKFLNKTIKDLDAEVIATEEGKPKRLKCVGGKIKAKGDEDDAPAPAPADTPADPPPTPPPTPPPRPPPRPPRRPLSADSQLLTRMVKR